MPKKKACISRVSKAALAVTINSDNNVVNAGMQQLCDSAKALLDTENPTKRQRKQLLDTAQTLLSLQGDVQQKVPSLVPSNCTQYAVGRLTSVANRQAVTPHCLAPRPNMRQRYFSVCNHDIPLPLNRSQYSAMEVCTILKETQLHIDTLTSRGNKDISINKVIDAIINYKDQPLVYATRSVVYRVFNNFKKTGVAVWPKMGRPPILDNTSFLSSIKEFEVDLGRATGKKDMNKILKCAKENDAKNWECQLQWLLLLQKKR